MLAVECLSTYNIQQPHNERAENDKWIGKLYFYYTKNH